MLVRWLCVVAASVATAAAQDAESGISIPMTLSGGAFYSQRLQFADPNGPLATAGFRAVIRPTIRLGSHWFAYGAFQVRMAPYFYYDAFDPDHDLYAGVLQAFIGYSLTSGNRALVIKAGRWKASIRIVPAAL